LRLFVVIGGLIVAVLVAALLAPLFVNWSDYKGRFEAEASRLLGQPVRVAGEASARILPFPSVSFTDVEVGPPEAPLMVAERFSLDAELAPFLSGEVLIFDMRLTEPVLTVTLDESGAPIWDLPEPRLIDPAQITLENATVENGTLIVLDPADERRWTMSDLDMAVSADSFFGPWRAEGTGRLGALRSDFVVSTGQLSREGFGLRMAANLPDYLVRVVSDGRIAPDEAGEMNYAGTLTLLPHQTEQPYRVEGAFTATARAIAVDSYRGEFGDPSDPYIVTGEAALFGGPEPGYRLTARGTQVNMSETGEEAGTARGLAERLSAINAMLAGLPWPAVPGTVNVDLPAIVAGDTTVRDVRVVARPEPDGADRRRWRIDRLDAQFPGRTIVEADGTLTLPRPGGDMDAARFAGNLVVASRQPSGLARWLSGTVDEPVRRLAGAGLSARVSLTAERQLAENVEIVLDGARLTGRMARRGRGPSRPYLAVDLAGADIGWPTLEVLGSVFGADAEGLALAGHDVDLTIDLETVDLDGVPAETLEASIRARGSRTEIDRLVATGVHGASVTAAGAVDAERSGALTVSVDASVIATDGAPFVRAMAARFDDRPLLDHLAGVARGDRTTLADMELTVVGSARTDAERETIEISASASGRAGGATLFAQASVDDAFATEPVEAASVDASVSHDDALRLLPLADVPLVVGEGATVGLNEPGAARIVFRRAAGGADAVTVLAEAGADRLRFEGTLAGPGENADVAGAGTLTLADAEPWLAALGHVLPGTGLGTPVQLETALTRQGTVWRFDALDGEVAGSAVTGDLTLTDDAVLGRSVRGALSLAELDAMVLAGLLTGHVDPLSSETTFGAPLYGDLAVQLDLTADRLFVGPVTLAGVDADLSMNGGLLTVQDLTGRHGEETAVAGNLRVQNAGGAVSLGGEVDLQAVPLAALAAMPVPISGEADLALSLTAGGNSLDALATSLTGTGVVEARDIVVEGLDADAFGPIIEAADAIGFGIMPAQIETIVADALLDGTARFGPVSAPLTVTGGVAQAANLALESPGGALGLTGQVTLDLAARQPGAVMTATLDARDEAIAGMAPVVGLSAETGAGGDLALATDFEPITAYLTQRALEIEQARIERLQARLLERQRLRRELRYARFMRTQENMAADEERMRALGRDRYEAEQAAARQAAEDEAVRGVTESLPAPAPGLAAPPDAAPPSPDEAPQETFAPTDEALETLDEGAVLRAPLPPPPGGAAESGATPRAAPAPTDEDAPASAAGIDFSEDAVRSVLEGLGQ